ncbi:hypothetical protein HY229_05720 [Candidatus Acetothermia bacterium]|nr:hypothetical protein [Candidatus Acetothermia bacterium]MBI3643580.1 hypothetical protein [Candidatus Acetothermia bacterium]
MNSQRKEEESKDSTSKELLRLLITVLIGVLTISCVSLAFASPKIRETNPRYIHDLQHTIELKKPDVILLGNSMLGEGIDPGEFEKLTGQRTLSFHQGGSESAYWYLFLKNIILTAKHRPKFLLLFFRDHFLTEPAFRVNGSYEDTISSIATDSEPLLDNLAYHNKSDLIGSMLMKLFNLYYKKESIRSFLENETKTAIERVLGAKVGRVQSAIDHTFQESNLIPELATSQELSSEKAVNKESYHFNNAVNKSFLPPIIAEAKAKGLKIIFVRVKRRRDVVPDAQPKELLQYIQDLKDYLHSQDLPIVDFTDDGRIRLEHFADGDHLGKSGRELFTPMLAESMDSYFKSPEK